MIHFNLCICFKSVVQVQPPTRILYPTYTTSRLQGNDKPPGSCLHLCPRYGGVFFWLIWKWTHWKWKINLIFFKATTIVSSIACIACCIIAYYGKGKKKSWFSIAMISMGWYSAAWNASLYFGPKSLWKTASFYERFQHIPDAPLKHTPRHLMASNSFPITRAFFVKCRLRVYRFRSRDSPD